MQSTANWPQIATSLMKSIVIQEAIMDHTFATLQPRMVSYLDDFQVCCLGEQSW